MADRFRTHYSVGKLKKIARTLGKCEKQYDKLQEEAHKVGLEKRKQRQKAQAGSTRAYLGYEAVFGGDKTVKTKEPSDNSSNSTSNSNNNSVNNFNSKNCSRRSRKRRH